MERQIQRRMLGLTDLAYFFINVISIFSERGKWLFTLLILRNQVIFSMLKYYVYKNYSVQADTLSKAIK